MTPSGGLAPSPTSLPACPPAAIFIIVGPVYNIFKNDASSYSPSKTTNFYLSRNGTTAECPANGTYIKVADDG